jgi:hypothetical protein
MTTTITRPVWQQTASEYQAMMGVHQPYIAEISPWQYSTLGKQAQARYDATRRQEWSASFAIKRTWLRLIVEAFERGDFALTDEGVTSETKTAIFHYQRDREEADYSQRLSIAGRSNRFAATTCVRVGDRIYSPLGGGYVIVTKVNRKTLCFATRHGDMRVPITACQWLSSDDLIAAVRNDAPIGPQREESAI